MVLICFNFHTNKFVKERKSMTLYVSCNSMNHYYFRVIHRHDWTTIFTWRKYFYRRKNNLYVVDICRMSYNDLLPVELILMHFLINGELLSYDIVFSVFKKLVWISNFLVRIYYFKFIMRRTTHSTDTKR